MIKLKFKNKDKELEFFKEIRYINEVCGIGIRYAEMINDLDQAEREKEDE